MIEQLQQQMGGAFWVVAIAAPVLVLVVILQIVFKTRAKVKQVKQVFRSGSIVTDKSAATTGPIAFGLACGAHMAVNQGVAWNDMEGVGFAKLELKMDLAEMWGVHDRTDWRRVSEAKLSPQTDNLEHVAVELRREVGATDHAGWQKAIHEAANIGRVPLHSVPALVEAAERITRYEERFRADGMVSGVVSSVRVYDWGRAVNLARWGLRLGYCDRTQAENVVLRVGELCATHYSSWADLSAGFAMGRLLFFDDEDFPVHYVTVREAHRKLLTEAESPFRTLPWPARR
ncbi:DUF1266 domain-containing protein [Actinophytocola sp.]|uniref:DUF1266 domain-containing protein n=1 Tax=Actinophytocola sp. TaxID=1872138 RepID=UPI002ED2D19C